MASLTEHQSKQRFLQLWTTNTARVALWADSSYGPLEERDILTMARELGFPLSSFNSSWGGGLTVKGDFHDPAGRPDDIVLIEMGYNDEANLSAHALVDKMRRQQWYRVLSHSVSMVKFVIFVEQASYRSVCPPKKKNMLNAGWERGDKLEGSQYTDQAKQLCEELGIPAFSWNLESADELWGDMLVHKDGELWQNEAVSRCAEMCTKKGPDYDPEWRLALWEDSWHPTAEGAQQHFRCLVKAFQARWGACGESLESGPLAAPAISSFAPKVFDLKQVALPAASKEAAMKQDALAASAASMRERHGAWKAQKAASWGTNSSSVKQNAFVAAAGSLQERHRAWQAQQAAGASWRSQPY